MHWRIKHIFNFPPDKPWEHGYVNFGFHGRSGAQYFLHYNEHWLGRLTAEDDWLWTAGAVDKGLSRVHIPFGIQHPHYITELPDNSLLVSSNGTNQIFRLRPAEQAVELFADTGQLGFRDIGNCVYDSRGSLWAHEIEGYRVWQLDLAGRPLRVLGRGEPGFQREAVPFEAARFNWIYDLRLGPDGDLYVLDSRNYCVRRIEVDQGVVSLVAGTGEPGPAAENVPALAATFGSDPSARFDGPFSLSLDEAGNIFIGDTYNHVVRMVERATRRTTIIAGRTRSSRASATIRPKPTHASSTCRRSAAWTPTAAVYSSQIGATTWSYWSSGRFMLGDMNTNPKPLGIKNYGSIPHLPGSRLGPGDHACHAGQAQIATEKARDRHDEIFVQEKLDGSNVGVARLGDWVHALTRAGYKATLSPYPQHHAFARWVGQNQARFLAVLTEGERLCGEWLMQAHGTRYALRHEPFVAFDLMVDARRLPYDAFMARCAAGGFVTPQLLHRGAPLAIAAAMTALGTYGCHGALDPVEGAVWRVERDELTQPGGGSARRRQVDFLVKYVRPDKVDGCYLPEISGLAPVYNWHPD